MLKAAGSKIGRSIRKRGLVGTFKAIVLNIWRQGIWDTIMVRYPEWRFDRRWGVSTAGIVPVPKDSSENLSLSEKYEATPPRLFDEVMNTLGRDIAGFVFLDVGCGKGRVLLMASQHPFQRIVGVELMPDLAAAAERNLEQARFIARRCNNLTVVCSNAAEFTFPDQNAVIFFFNPFKEAIMRRVLDNIRSSVVATTERYILYLEPRLSQTLDACPFLELLAKKERYCIYRLVPSRFGQRNGT